MVVIKIKNLNLIYPQTQLPIGEKDLFENRQKIDLVQGIEQYRIIRGDASLQDGFEAEIAFAKNEQEFLKFEAAIQKLGYPAKKVIPPNNSQAEKNIGYWVRVDSRFSSVTQAGVLLNYSRKKAFYRQNMLYSRGRFKYIRSMGYYILVTLQCRVFCTRDSPINEIPWCC